jgi:hypothetical protein
MHTTATAVQRQSSLTVKRFQEPEFASVALSWVDSNHESSVSPDRYVIEAVCCIVEETREFLHMLRDEAAALEGRALWRYTIPEHCPTTVTITGVNIAFKEGGSEIVDVEPIVLTPSPLPPSFEFTIQF